MAPENAESVTVSAADLRRVLQYIEERVQLRSFAGQEMLNILDRLGDAVLKEPKVGMRFLHARQITQTSTAKAPVPEECVVTAVRAHTVYFHNSTGFKSKVARDRFDAVVREVLR